MMNADQLAKYIQQREQAKQRRRRQARQTDRFFRIRNSIIISIVFFLIVLGGLVSYEQARRERYSFTTTTQIEVQRGDTLWTIAEQARTTNRQDIRQIVFIIQQQNELQGGLIFPHQILQIPVFDNPPAFPAGQIAQSYRRFLPSICDFLQNAEICGKFSKSP